MFSTATNRASVEPLEPVSRPMDLHASDVVADKSGASLVQRSKGSQRAEKCGPLCLFLQSPEWKSPSSQTLCRCANCPTPTNSRSGNASPDPLQVRPLLARRID